MERKETGVSRVMQVPLDSLDSWVHLVDLELLDRLVNKEMQDNLVLREISGPWDLRDCRVLQVTRALQDLRDLLA